MRQKHFVFLALLALPLLGQQCIRFGGGSSGTDGGVYKSVNNGGEWKQKSAIPTVTGSPRTFGSANIVMLAQDPADRLALYAGTRESGMLYTYDGGETWRQPKDLVQGAVNAVAVDPKDKCTVYVATANRVLKTTDCSRSYAESYRDATAISAFAADYFNTGHLYLGTEKGAVLKSADGGRTWGLLQDLKGKIIDIVINPKDSRIVYVAVSRRGVWKSTDAGRSWQDLTGGFKKLAGSTDIKRLVVSGANAEIVVMASKYGLIRSKDGGASWEPLTLLTKPGSIEIDSLALDPKSANRLYYGTTSTFYKSEDGGATWSTKKLPTSRAATALLVDAGDSNVIYLGALKIAK